MAKERLAPGRSHLGQWVRFRHQKEWFSAPIVAIRKNTAGQCILTLDTAHGRLPRIDTHCYLAANPPGSDDEITGLAPNAPPTPIGSGTGRYTGWDDNDEKILKREQRRDKIATIPRIMTPSSQADRLWPNPEHDLYDDESSPQGALPRVYVRQFGRRRDIAGCSHPSLTLILSVRGTVIPLTRALLKTSMRYLIDRVPSWANSASGVCYAITFLPSVSVGAG